MPPKGKSRQLSTVKIIGSLVVGLAGIALIAWIALIVFAPSSCAPKLLVNGRTLDMKAAVSGLKLDTSASPIAQAVITEKLQFYLNQSAQLCSDHDAGRISEADYGKRQDQLAAWYMEVSDTVKSGKLRQVGQDQKDELARQTSALAGAAPAQTMAQVTLIDEDGRLLQNGGIVRNGDRIAITVKLSKQTYLYIVGAGTSGKVYRIFPSRLLAGENPVTGELRIPQEPGAFLTIGGDPGTERIFFFFNGKPDDSLDKLTEISSTSESKSVARSLENVFATRDFYAPVPTAKGPSPAQPIDVKGRFGAAALKFEYLHAQ